MQTYHISKERALVTTTQVKSMDFSQIVTSVGGSCLKKAAIDADLGILGGCVREHVAIVKGTPLLREESRNNINEYGLFQQVKSSEAGE